MEGVGPGQERRTAPEPAGVHTEMYRVGGHGTYIRWYPINRCARQEQSLLFDLYKAFDKLVSSHKHNIFLRRDLFSFMLAQHVMSYLLL